MHAVTTSFSYSRLESCSETTLHSRQRGSAWLPRPFKFLLRSAPPTDTAEGLRSDFRRSIAQQKFGLKRSNSSEEPTEEQEILKERPRAMDPHTSEGAGATQVELRTEGFQATLLWERIVSHLERTVKPGRHSYALRSYDNCFPGHKAVDCLMVYMNSVLPKSVKKSQARLLGQKLLLTKVIEDARKKEKTVFRESRLYRFTGTHFWDPPREVHGSRACNSAAVEGGVYRCHSIENISHSCPSHREQKRKPSRRTNGYMSDSTLASSSLGKRVVQIRSSRGMAASRLAVDSYSAKSQLSTSVQADRGYHSQQHTSHKSRWPWFHSDSSARSRDMRSKYLTPTITEEPSILRSTSPPRASPMIPRSPAVDFKVREPCLPMPDRSRVYPMYPERPYSPDSSCMSSVSGYSHASSQLSSVRCQDYTLQSHRPDVHQRLVPRPPILNTGPTPPSQKHCNGHLDSRSACSNEQDQGWVVYGYV